MRRPLSFLIAAAMAATSTVWSIAPTEAASVRMAPAAASQGRIELVGDWGGNWDDDNWRGDNWRHHRRHHRRHDHDDFDLFPSFSFGFAFPYAYTPRYRYVPQQDCFRTWDGRIYCSVY